MFKNENFPTPVSCGLDFDFKFVITSPLLTLPFLIRDTFPELHILLLPSEVFLGPLSVFFSKYHNNLTVRLWDEPDIYKKVPIIHRFQFLVSHYERYFYAFLDAGITCFSHPKFELISIFITV